MRTLEVNLTELEAAMSNSSWEMSYYLDLQTGEVLMVSDDDKREMEQICEEIDEEDDERALARFKEMLAAGDAPGWEHEGILAAYQIEYGSSDRYLPVPRQESHEGYSDMEAFIPTVRSERLQEKLWRAISGRGAFRYFKDVLTEVPAERERWFTFSNERERQRMLDWLESEGIEPARPDEPGP